MNAFIIHGVWGSPQENWIPWLKTKLEAQNIATITPKFPTPEGHNLRNWIRIMEEHKKNITSETLLIGHSISCAFILDMLEIMNVQVRACFLIAGWTGPLHDEELDALNRTFAERTFNWTKIRANCKKFYLFNSTNDPYVPVELGVELARNLQSSMTTVPNAGHFNQKAGYTTFPLLLTTIKKELSPV